MVINMRGKILSIFAMIIIIGTIIPVSEAVNVICEKDEIDEILSSNNIMRMFFIGRISDLTLDEQGISFYPTNLWIIAYQRYEGSTTSYIGHIKNMEQRFTMPQEYKFRGILTNYFIFGGYRYMYDENPEVPSITFVKDEEDHTLTVVAVEPDDVLWDDLRIEHEGSIVVISEDGDGIVEPGEEIISLYGLVRIYHKPTDALLSTWQFPPMAPLILFTQNEDEHTLTVTSVIPNDVLWYDLRIENEGGMTGVAEDGDGIVEPGEMIFSLYGSVEIYYEPTNVLLSSWEFPPKP